MKKNELHVSEREFRVLEFIWENTNNHITSQEIVAHFSKQENGGYAKSTIFTFLKRLINKKALVKIELGIYAPLLNKEDVRINETSSLFEKAAKIYGGSKRRLISSFIGECEEFTDQEIQELKSIIDGKKDIK